MTNSKRQKEKKLPLTLTFILNFGAALLVLVLVQLFVAKIYQVPSESMERTLEVGDRIVANRIGLHFSAPENGDIVVFSEPGDWNDASSVEKPSALKSVVKGIGDVTGVGPSNTHYLVKRIIGSPLDTVECCTAEGSLLRNGERVEEPYLFEDFEFVSGSIDCTDAARSPRCFGPVKVPEGHYLVMGDHRSRSADSVADCRMLAPGEGSECAKFVPEGDVVGEVAAVIWPFGNLGPP